MDKTRQERYNMIYGNTARKIEASTQPASTQPERNKDQEEKYRQHRRPNRIRKECNLLILHLSRYWLQESV